MKEKPEDYGDFVALLTVHQSDLRIFLTSLMPGLGGVDDVLQETNMVLWRKRSRFKLGTNFKAWAFTVARYEALKHRHKLGRDGWLTLDENLATELAEEAAEDSSIDTETRITALRTCLARLKKSERDLVDQRYESDETLVEYAERLGRPVGSVRVSLHRIRAALRRCVSGQLKLGLNHHE